MGTLLRDHAIKDFHLSTNEVYIEAVNRVGHRIANAINERPDLADDGEFTVIDSANVNAFATGGGKVVVFEGLLDRISKDNGGRRSLSEGQIRDLATARQTRFWGILESF